MEPKRAVVAGLSFLDLAATGCFSGSIRVGCVTVVDITVLNFTSRGSLITGSLRTAFVAVPLQ